MLDTPKLKIFQLPVGQLETNCYLVADKQTQETIIIDPGDDAEHIKQKILDHELNPVSIIATHGHFDHIGAVLDLQLSFSIPFLINKEDEFLVSRVQSSSKHFTGVDTGPPPKINFDLKKTSELKIANCKLQIIPTPGHTPGSITLFSPENEVAFVGDLIFEKGGVGRTDFKYADPLKLAKSIKSVQSLPGETVVLSGHGNPFILASHQTPNFTD